MLDQSAQDVGRYDFVKDIQRLEASAVGRPASSGYAILLTNDSAYWAQPSRDTVDAAFRLQEGRQVTGELAWSERASPGTIRSPETPLNLTENYTLNWADYSRISVPSYGRFRSLIVGVSRALPS